MHTDPIMFWQAVIVLAVLAGSIVYNLMRPAKKE
ncbi:Uncharacterised protein [Shigella sonnei]|nr:Uncharacterised protein [Shigella sonnei]